MTISRRGLIGIFTSALAAPAIVKVESLMKLGKTEIIRAPAVSLRMLDSYAVGDDALVSRLDVLYGSLRVRPEWKLTLDDFSARILAPMVNRMQQQVADAIIYGQSASWVTLEADGTGTLPAGTRELVPLLKPIGLADLLVEARKATCSAG